MTKLLRISAELALPPEAVTETFGLLAVRGAGKSNAARVMAEEMFKAGLPFVAVDPVGSWRGLRAARDGQGAGLPIPIFGGKWGDVPLERGGGQLLADLVVDQRLSCVLDLTTLDSETSKKAFLLDFARRLYQRNEEPLHLFLEEADDYIPQRPMRDEAQLLRAWENIVRRGRARGLGCTLITQRSAAIAKDVLTQVQTLIAMRTTGPQDVAAIAAWLKYHAQGEEILESLATLKAGEAWVWSPVFLGKTERIRFRLSSTFDSGATPKAGKAGASRAAATLADVDLVDIQKRMTATIERAKAEDPRELRKRIAELEERLRVAAQGRADARLARDLAKARDVPALKASYVKRLEKVVDKMLRQQDSYSRALVLLDQGRDSLAQSQQIVLAEAESLRNELRRALAAPAAAALAVPTGAPRQAPSGAGGSRLRPPALPPPMSGNGAGGPELGKTGARRMLSALAQHRQGLTASKLSLLSGIARRGGTWRTYMGQLRSGGFVTRGEPIRITEAGLHALGGDFEPLPEGPALIEFWRARLGDTGKRRIFDVIVAAYPRALSYEEVAAATGIAPAGGTWRTYVGELRTLDLIHGRGELRASDDLFP